MIHLGSQLRRQRKMLSLRTVPHIPASRVVVPLHEEGDDLLLQLHQLLVPLLHLYGNQVAPPAPEVRRLPRVRKTRSEGGGVHW